MEDNETSPEARPLNTASDELRGLRRVVWGMAIILAVSLSINVLLAYRIKGLNNTFSKLAPPLPLVVGASVPPLKANNLQGGQDTIYYGGDSDARPVVIYVFTPQCSWCARNLDNFKTLLAEKQESYRFVALSMTDVGLREYIAENKLDLRVYFNPTEESVRDYKFSNTPQTIVVSPEGKVLQNWVGAYAGRQQADVEKYFGVHMPGLAPSK